jgi:hypothetical protein
MSLELTLDIPSNLYILSPATGAVMSKTQVYEVTSRSDLVYLQLQSIVCGDIGFPRPGNLFLWFVQTQGPVVDSIRQLSGNPQAVSLVGFIDIDILRKAVNPVTNGCLIHLNIQIMCICPAYGNQGYGKQLWKSAEQYLFTVPVPSCQTIDILKISLEGTISEISSETEFKRKIQEAEDQKDSKKVEKVLSRYTTGSWKFWRRMGFTFTDFMQGNVYMAKSLSRPARLRLGWSGPTLLHSVPSTGPKKRSKAKKRGVTFADTDEIQIIEPRSKKPRKS